MTFLAFGAALLGHEGAHFALAYCLYTRGDWASLQPPVVAHAAVVAAGPLFTLMTTLACALAAVRWRRLRWLTLAVPIFGASRLVMIGPVTLIGKGVNDEGTLGRLLGMSPRWLWTIEALATAGAIAFISRRTAGGDLRRHFPWIVAGIVIGWVSALTVGRAIGLPI